MSHTHTNKKKYISYASKEKIKKKKLCPLCGTQQKEIRSNLGGRVPLCHPPGGSRRAWASSGDPAAPWHPHHRPPPQPGDRPPEPRLQPEVRKRRRGRCHQLGWDGRKRGKGARRGEAKGETRELRTPQPRSGKVGFAGAQGAQAPAIVAGPCGRRLREEPFPRTPQPARPAAGRRDSHKLPPRPGPPRRPPSRRGHCSPHASYLVGSGGSGFGLRAAGCGAGEGAVAASEGSPRAAGARARQAAAGRGPSHQRWRGAEGRAEQAGWVGSALRVALAASTPGRSATRVGRSGAERAATASPPRASAGLRAPRSRCARAGTSCLRGW